jgi:hypothetical protein
MKHIPLFENEHTLDSPPLIGTDEEKIRGIAFWADVVRLLRTINTTFISFENKQAILKHIKQELERVDVEINNVSSQIVSAPGEIPSAQQVPSDETAADATKVVDLTKSDEVAAMAGNEPAPNRVQDNPVIKQAPPLKKPPTFSDMAKLKRVAGTGEFDKSYVVLESNKADSLDKLRRAAGTGRWADK